MGIMHAQIVLQKYVFLLYSFLSPVLYDDTQVIYPYEKNNYEARTHHHFLTTAKAVEAKVASGRSRRTSVAGIKGLSSLLKVLHYPVDVVYDYMHLICLNHVPTLIKRFTGILSKNDIDKTDSILSAIRLPHDVNVRYNYSIQSINDWKAKDNRLLIHYYCQTSSKVYDPKIELYSLHAHLHLPAQVLIMFLRQQLPNIVCSFVLDHGGLAFTSSFCFESAIRSIKNKSHGTKNLGSQIGYWCDIDTIIPLNEFELMSPSLVDEIKLDSDLLKAHRGILTKKFNDLQQDITTIKLYLRFKDKFVTYHSFLYGKRFTCISYLISYNDNYQQIQYGNIIIFYIFNDVWYSLIQQYHRADINISDFLEIPNELKEIIDLFYPICFLSDTFVIIPMSSKTNSYQRPYLTQRVSTEKKRYSCIAYLDEPSKYSIVDSKRLANIDDRGYGIIKELGKSYNIHVEQTGTQESMEKYGCLLEKAMQSQMHEEVPSDCEEWRAKQRKENQSKALSTPLRPSLKSKSSNKQPKQTLSPAPKEFSLKDIFFGQTPPSSLLSQSGSSDNTRQSRAHIQGEKEANHDSSSSDDDEDENSKLTIDIEEDLADDLPSSSIRLPPTTTSKKRASKSKKKTPIAKRLRFTMNDDDDEKDDEEQQLDLQQTVNYVKQVNANVLKMQKQQEKLAVTLGRQNTFLNNLCKNQKKLAKSLARRKIPVFLEEDDENAIDQNSTDYVSTYTRSDGLVVELLKVYGTKENTVKYALKLIDALFIDKQDLQNADSKKIDEDPRVKAIYGPIKQKFNFSVEEMSIIWPPVHDSILSKRRNQGKILKANVTQNESTSTTLTLQAVNHNNNEQQDETGAGEQQHETDEDEQT
ncbi:unnamed protein product [Didymodactylos carnosus]|uniref:Uncharacterized protein n=1 Tax=Didymodactylos carnosus TaxID=1234261 RepID=A0A814P812_9BILA|nr:unnamed protein product [Didymodactylos carnosus]CAF3869002.1 unnamed protein product [Didymodactylos carnosus]